MKYRVMAKQNARRHHQEGPDYDTKAQAEAAAAEWRKKPFGVAHVEPVQAHRTYATGGIHATD